MKNACKVLHEVVRRHNANSITPISKTKLLSIFYLFERSYYLDNNYTYIGSPYVKYSKGPYCKKLEDILDESIENHFFHETELVQDTSIRYQVCNCPLHQTNVSVSSNVLDTVDDIMEDYGDMTEEDIAKHIRSLPEIKKTQKYGLIRFSDAETEN